jgi:AraC-like DNA-binding protein
MVDADRLRQILEVIEESLDAPDLAGAELAEGAYLSSYHFDRLVRAAVGEPPGAFRRRLLLERAACRRVRTDDAVIDVAFDAGYAAPEAFARAKARPAGPLGKGSGGRVASSSCPPPLSLASGSEVRVTSGDEADAGARQMGHCSGACERKP